MKRFFLMILLTAVFFTGLGGMLRETTARFKSDDKALAILQKARQAIGGDSSLAAVNSLIVTGKSTRTLRFDGTVEKTLQGDMEIALQFPDKMMKSIKMIHNDGGATGEKIMDHQVDVIIANNGDGNIKWKVPENGDASKAADGKKVIVIKKDDGTTETADGNEATFEVRKVASDLQAELAAGGGRQMVFTHAREGAPGEFPWQTGFARTALSLLLTAPQGTEVSYLYGGEESVDGTACNVINAQFSGSAVKLYIGRDSNLPVMMSYQDAKPMIFRFQTNNGEVAGDKEAKTFTRHAGPPEMAEYQIRFSDYRSVNGVLLPYKWTQTMAGLPDEIVDVTSYEINPANIADKFKASGETKVMLRRTKEQ
jgi:hypothetical protein